MHHPLLMPEVRAYLLATIMEDKQAGRCTLAMLARTCSVFSEASLDALWSDLDSLHPLASCIYAANTRPLSDESNNNMEPDLSVFYKYAHRIRTLDLSGQRRRSDRHPSVTDDIFALIYYAVPSPLLPNLRQLAWAPGISLSLLRHLLNPRLQSLKIPNQRWSQEHTLFALSRIPGLCPDIKSLTLQIVFMDECPEQESARSCISRVICSWGKLEELDCNPTTPEDVLRLCGLSSLRNLRLQVNNQSVVNLLPESLSFPSLHTLRFNTDTLETAITLFGAIKSSPRSVTIDVYASRRECRSPENLEVLLRLVSRDSSRHALQDFSVNLPYILGADPVNISDMLRPLFLCCGLRSLRIHMTLRFILGDADLRTMATAWPHLEKLELVDSRPRVLVPSPQLLLPMGFGHPNQHPQPPLPIPPVGSVQATQPQQTVTASVNPHQLPELPIPAANTDQGFRVKPSPPETTFHGLISLLELCPSLYYFDLSIDASKLDGLHGDKPGGGVCNRLVKCARLIDSPVGDPSVVARILLDILPELDSLAGAKAQLPDPPHNVAFQGWPAVRQIILASRHATTQP